jgi:hypothetical protein
VSTLRGRWAVFEDEDHVFRIVTEEEGDDVTWPEMDDKDCERVVAAHNAILAEEAELQAVFDLQWKADRRATKLWQEAHPGSDLVWPDRADLVVWLMEQVEQRA